MGPEKTKSPMVKPSSDPENRKWNTKSTYMVTNTLNPIRNILQTIPKIPNPDLPMISLSIGDPSVFGNFPVADEAIHEVLEVAKNGKSNGYGPSMGTVEARQGVAEYAKSFMNYKPNIDDIALSNGASGAIEFAISALAGAGDNILVPAPGFPLYEVLAIGQGIAIKTYNLLPDKSWEVCLSSLEETIDEKTAAIVFINPSNPCGAVFSEPHMKDLINLCERYKLPIIADEIYAGMVFKGKFNSFAALTNEVPIIICGGLAKRFLIPGWRLGWTIVHDPANIFQGCLSADIVKLTTRLVGPNSIIQAAIPNIIKNVPEAWHDLQNKKLFIAATTFFDGLKNVSGLTPIMPSGAMYMMVKIDMKLFPSLKDDTDFVTKLISCKSVFCLPGKCFGVENFIRIVITVPQEVIPDAVKRIADFCEEMTQSCDKTSA